MYPPVPAGPPATGQGAARAPARLPQAGLLQAAPCPLSPPSTLAQEGPGLQPRTPRRHSPCGPQPGTGRCWLGRLRRPHLGPEPLAGPARLLPLLWTRTVSPPPGPGPCGASSHSLCGSFLAVEHMAGPWSRGVDLRSGVQELQASALTAAPPSPQMPVCSYFLKGICSNSDCPYSHVYVSRKAEVCTDFLKGYCPLGAKVSLQEPAALSSPSVRQCPSPFLSPREPEGGGLLNSGPGLGPGWVSSVPGAPRGSCPPAQPLMNGARLGGLQSGWALRKRRHRAGLGVGQGARSVQGWPFLPPGRDGVLTGVDRSP